jgi:2-C-methyl-D-erythritol 2,4-cyclodiphosphate synthase
LSVRMRIGQGIDIHRFSDDPHRPLILGGVVIEGGRGLAGHSDADAVCHALSDAILGAVGLGDLGHHFPDTDPVWEGANSVELLTEVVRMTRVEGFAVVNGDCTVVADAPRLAPYTEAMITGLSLVLNAPVSVKATRAEGLGALGRAEGIACMAIVLLEQA